MGGNLGGPIRRQPDLCASRRRHKDDVLPLGRTEFRRVCPDMPNTMAGCCLGGKIEVPSVPLVAPPIPRQGRMQRGRRGDAIVPSWPARASGKRSPTSPADARCEVTSHAPVTTRMRATKQRQAQRQAQKQDAKRAVRGCRVFSANKCHHGSEQPCCKQVDERMHTWHGGCCLRFGDHRAGPALRAFTTGTHLITKTLQLPSRARQPAPKPERDSATRRI